MLLFETLTDTRTLLLVLCAGLAAWTVWAMVGWDRAADAADRWKAAAHAYAKALRDQRAMQGPVMTRVAPEYHAPAEGRNSDGFVGRAADDPLDMHVRPTRVFKAPWLS